MPAYTLKYFDARGVAETCRLIFAVAGQGFEDVRYPIAFGTPGDFSTIIRKEFDVAKENGEFTVSGGKLPLLLVDGAPVCGQSKAMERYLAASFGLMGSNPAEGAHIDALCENIRDMKDAYNAAKRTAEPEREAAIKKYFDETLVNSMAGTEKSLPASGQFLIGDKISLADVAWYQFVGSSDKPFFDNVEGARNSYKDCPRISAAMLNTDRNANLQAWIASRPKTMM